MIFLLIIFCLQPSFAGKKIQLGIPLEVRSTHQDSLRKITTKESTISIEGIKYRQIEYNTEIFYIRLRGIEELNQLNEIECAKIDKFKTKSSAPLIVADAKITERTSLFLETLRVNCQKIESTQSSDFLKLGISYKGKTGHQYKVNINPLHRGLGLSGTF